MLDWTNIQSGVWTVIPPLDVALITIPRWEDSPEIYLSKVVFLNPAAVSLGSEKSVSRFLLVQLGGGVEGLRYQALLSEEDESVTIWRGPFESQQKLFEPQSVVVPAEKIRRIFGSVAVSGLRTTSRVEWQCDTLDGAVAVFVYYDGDRVGRIAYVNSRRPSVALRRVLRELFLATGSTDKRLTVYEDAA
ncbi:MAG: hypothetical protein GY769_14605 [bacterium]|nr:hypothetical protein [bacterium]